MLRLIDEHIDFSFVREQLKDSYSDTGRPSIDPELLLRIVLIGYLYGVSSERKLVEELRMHLAWRWFTGLGFDQEIPHHSTFSKNRHGRFHESKLFGQMFERIVAQCLEVGLVRGDKLSVDGTFVEANASKESRIPREQLAEAAQVNRTVREWLTELEAQYPVGEPTHSQDKVSTTDPDSTYATKGGTPARMGYYNNYLVDKSQLHYRRRASYGCSPKRGIPSCRRDDRSLRSVATKKPTVHRRRCELWQRRVVAVVDGSEDYTIHAHPRCRRSNKKSALWSGALQVSA